MDGMDAMENPVMEAPAMDAPAMDAPAMEDMAGAEPEKENLLAAEEKAPEEADKETEAGDNG